MTPCDPYNDTTSKLHLGLLRWQAFLEVLREARLGCFVYTYLSKRKRQGPSLTFQIGRLYLKILRCPRNLGVNNVGSVLLHVYGKFKTGGVK